MSDLIIFDLDGVITSEEAYWDTAGLVLHELCYSPRYWNMDVVTAPYHPVLTAEESRRVSRATLPEAAIVGFKARAINSNWDTCYTGVCLSLIYLLSLVPDCAALLPLRPADADWIAAFRQQLSLVSQSKEMSLDHFFPFDAPIFRGYTGIELMNRLNLYASEVLGQHIEGVFARYSPSWLFCQKLFQEWYLGEDLYTRTYGRAPRQLGKPGCIHFEQPLLPAEAMQTALKTLCERGYMLGVATGRPGQESLLPLENYGVLRYFDRQHITTQDEAARAEAELRARGDTTSLMKPHPYQFLLSANPAYRINDPLPPRGSFVVVGDTTSDMLGGRAAGALTIAVLTGARTSEARLLLEQSKPDFIVDDMTKVPALLTQLDSLATIQRLQFSEREKAEVLLMRWFARHMHLQVERVTLTPKAVSLNSFNGFYHAAGEEYFFKTHIEEQGVLEEYYHAELLRKVDYNIVKPLYTLHEKDQQMVIYPVVRWPVMFDLMRAVETGNTEQASVEMLVAAEQRECERLLSIYRSTAAISTAEEHAKAPIHQLFWHRLVGGRLKSFYAGKNVPLRLDADHSLFFEELLTYRWHINGVAYPYTLGELIERAKLLLDPVRAGLTVIGHGDAHFGNVFLEQERDYLYFDPAFAGRHSPLLDVVKPFFHNVFATWMYFPHAILHGLHLSALVRNDTIIIEHNYALTPVRQAMLHTKVEHMLRPLITYLHANDALPADWQELLQSALLCCPLLTVNLLDTQRMPIPVSWLGFSFAMQMGNDSVRSWGGDI